MRSLNFRTLLIIGLCAVVVFSGVAAAASQDTDSTASETTTGPSFTAPGATEIVVHEITVTDQGSGDGHPTDIDSFQITNSGSATDADISSIQIYKESTGPGFSSNEDTAVGGSVSTFTRIGGDDDGVITSVSDGTSDTFYVVVDLASDATDGETIQVDTQVDTPTGTSTSEFSSGDKTTVSASSTTEIDATPDISSATTADSDNNGQLDEVDITFSESVQVDDGSPGNGIDGLQVGGGSEYGIDGVSGNPGSTITVSIAEKSSPDTDATPAVSYTQSGGLSDDNQQNKEIAATSPDVTPSDGAAPAMAAALTADNNNNGTVDQINVTMSEPLDDSQSTIDSTTFASVDTYTIGKASSETGDDDEVEVVVTGTPSNDTSITTSNLKLNSGKLEDQTAARNSLGSDQTLSTVSDGAAPTFKALSTADANNNGYVDELSVTFTEAIASDEVAPGDLSIGTASGLDGATSVNSDSGDDGDDTVTIGLSEGKNTFDTDATPTLQYTDDGNGDGDQIQDGNGNAMVSIESETASDGAGPGITSFQATNPGGQNVNVSIDTGEQLGGSAGDIAVSISGAETANLNRNDFTEYGSGPYTYATTYDGSSDGTYKTTLDTAQDAIGNDGANSESSSATVDTITPAPSSSSSPPTTSYSGTSVSRREGGTVDQNTEAGTASVSFSQASDVQSITFDSASVSGSVVVRELSSAPSVANSAPGTYVSAIEIVVPDAAKDTSATIRLRVPADEVNTEETQLQINRYNDESQSWEALSTEVTSRTDEQISLRAETPGFSLFTVSAVEEGSSGGTEDETKTDTEEGNGTDTDTESDSEETDDTADETADGIPGFGISVSLVALIAIALIARRKQR